MTGARADGQADDEVGLVVAWGEHEHRLMAIFLDPSADLEPVEAGEHEVEHDQVGFPAQRLFHPARAVAGGADLEPLAAQAGRDRIGDGSLVFDDQDASCHARHVTEMARGGGATST